MSSPGYYTYTEPADLTVGQALEAYAEGRLQVGYGNSTTPIAWWTPAGWVDPESEDFYEDRFITRLQEGGIPLDTLISDPELITGYYAVRVAPEGVEEHRLRLWRIFRNGSREQSIYGFTDTPIYIEAETATQAYEIYHRLSSCMNYAENRPILGGKVYREEKLDWHLNRPATSFGEWTDVTEEDIERDSYWFDDEVNPGAEGR